MLGESIFDFGCVGLSDINIPEENKVELFADGGDPGRPPRSAASDPGLLCLLAAHLWGWGWGVGRG